MGDRADETGLELVTEDPGPEASVRPVAITNSPSSGSYGPRQGRNPWMFVSFVLALILVAGGGFALGNRNRDAAGAPVVAATTVPVGQSADDGVNDGSDEPVDGAAADVNEPGDDAAGEPDADAEAASPEPPAEAVAAEPVSEPPVEPPAEAVVAEPVTEPPAEATADEPPIDPAIPESKATIRNGQIFLEGAVPTREDGDAIVALAAEILGEENVFDDYVIDPAAADPGNGNITVEDTINFATESAVIQAEGEGLLNQGLALFTIRPAVTATIVGHTDDRGSDDFNLVLSVARAEAVKQWYVDHGVDPARLSVRGAGELEPIAPNDTSDGRRQNRRIQFILENVLSG